MFERVQAYQKCPQNAQTVPQRDYSQESVTISSLFHKNQTHLISSVKTLLKAQKASFVI